MRRDDLEALLPEALDLLRRHVEVNSFTFHRDGVVQLGDMTVDLFGPLGFAAHRLPSVTPACGDHIVLERDGAPGGKRLVLVSHLDTVFPPSTTFPWSEREGDSWVEGPGVCDIKGGTILMWMVLRVLRDRRPDLFESVTWRLLFNATEEGGCSDFPEIARAEVTPGTRACLVYEAGMPAGAGSTVVAQRKGCGRFRLDAYGHPAHSGNAHEHGASAIRELARQIERIEQLTDYVADQTFSVGLIQGGTAVNSIPDHAWADIDVRSWTTDAEMDGQRKLEEIAAHPTVRSADGAHGCRLTLTPRPGYPPWPKNDATERLVAVALDCGGQLDLKLVRTKRRGG
ncbi:MAG: M20/M25/M40 family metallo-hydrolase, partial [Planctomycetota bacterium]|nr:M20/M25/M40 family metallo-hydrolase [Planctomycetota bacterium]